MGGIPTCVTLMCMFEATADAQKMRFLHKMSAQGKKNMVCDVGLWQYTRHPNYFGELCVWWGLFLIACDNVIGLVTIIGPLMYSFLVINVTGQRTLDKKLAREKPGYAAYMEVTSGLIPMPPKKENG